MKAIDADFVPRGPERRWPWWTASALFLGMAAFELNSARRLEAELQRLQAASVDVPAAASRSGAAAPPVYYEDALRYARLANLDVAGVFASLESARVQGVRVTSIEIRAEEAQARVELEVRAPEDLLRYVDEINAGIPGAERWNLVRSQSATTTNVGAAVLVKAIAPRS